MCPSKVCINKTLLLSTANVGEWKMIIWSNNSSLRWGSRGLICQWGPIRQQCDDFLQQPSPGINRSVRSGSRGCSSAASHGFSRPLHHLKIFFNRWKIPLLIRERGFRCWVQDWTLPRWVRFCLSSRQVGLCVWDTVGPAEMRQAAEESH